MALTGNTVASTYLDLVQLEQSGAGLPSHAGKEAALYDGSGAQIVGRTAIRHWLDPDPDAIATSYEFSTMGDTAQAALETAGWTFTNCTAEVVGGLLVLTKNVGTGNVVKAETTVSLSGNFDYTMGTVSLFNTDPGNNSRQGAWLWVGDQPTGYAAGIASAIAGGGSQVYGDGYKGSTYNSLTGGTAWNGTTSFAPGLCRISRFAGTVYIGAGHPGYSFRGPAAAAWNDRDYWRYTSDADASTYDRLIVTLRPDGNCISGFKFGIAFIRRYV
jgi:hypothetical protein